MDIATTRSNRPSGPIRWKWYGICDSDNSRNVQQSCILLTTNTGELNHPYWLTILFVQIMPKFLLVHHIFLSLSYSMSLMQIFIYSFILNTFTNKRLGLVLKSGILTGIFSVPVLQPLTDSCCHCLFVFRNVRGEKRKIQLEKDTIQYLYCDIGYFFLLSFFLFTMALPFRQAMVFKPPFHTHWLTSNE